MGGQILISEATLREAGPDVRVGERLLIEAKGTREPIVAYDLLGIGGEYALLLPEGSDERRAPRPAAAGSLPLPGRQVLEGRDLRRRRSWSSRLRGAVLRIRRGVSAPSRRYS